LADTLASRLKSEGFRANVMQLGKIPWKRFDVRKLESEKSNLAPFGFT